MGPVITILFGPCILQLFTKFISSRLQQFQAKLMLLQGWELVSNIEHPNLDQVERDFCSARQAYAQAQQEEVTEERDLRPNPKKHLEYEVSRGGVVRGSTLTETAHPGQAP